jgi:hypothetical protein
LHREAQKSSVQAAQPAARHKRLLAASGGEREDIEVPVDDLGERLDVDRGPALLELKAEALEHVLELVRLVERTSSG